MANVSKIEYAKHRGVSRQAVYKAVETKRIPMNADGTIPLEAADAAWNNNTDPSKPSSTAPGGAGRAEPEAAQPAGGALYQAKAAKERVDAKIKMIRLQQMTGELLPAADVKLAAYKHARDARNLLVAMPDRIATLCAAESDPAKVHALIAEEIDRVCEELFRPVKPAAAEVA